MTAAPGPNAANGSIAPSTASIFTASTPFTVPDGCIVCLIEAWGGISAAGVGAPSGNATGGSAANGGYVRCHAQVTPGGVLLAVVVPGGVPGSGQTFMTPANQKSGAGGAGGAGLAVWRDTVDPATLLVYAGGGGGGGGAGAEPSNNGFGAGGAGGEGGVAPNMVSAGSSGVTTPFGAGVPGGGAAGSSAGSAGSGGTFDPAAGTANGAGGNGGWGAPSGTPAASTATGGGGGGGGGAGYPFGGGGGGGGVDTANGEGAGGGGGAGGNSWATPNAIGAPVFVPGVQTAGAAVMITPNPPARPLITSPAPGPVDVAAGFALTATFASPVGSAINQYALRVRTAGTSTWTWLNLAAITGSPTETALPASGPTLTVPAGLLTNGTSYEFEVAFYDAYGAMSPYSAPLTVQACGAPTVTVTAPSTATQNPVVSWETSLFAGEVQSAWSVVLTTEAAPGAVLWSLSGYGPTASAQLPWLAAGTPYTVTVSVTDSAGVAADGAVSWTPAPATVPAAPTVSAIIPAVSGSGPTPPSVNVTITAAAGMIGDVQRSTDGGTTWTSLPAASGIPLGTVTDLTLTPMVATLYRACVETADGTARSPWQSSAVAVTASSSTEWFVDPVTEAAAAVMVTDNPSVGLTDRQAVYDQLPPPGTDKTASTVLSAGIGSDTPQITVTFLDEPSWQQFLAVRSTQNVLLFQPRFAGQWFVRLGQLTVTMLDPVVRQVTIPMTEVAAPATSTSVTVA